MSSIYLSLSIEFSFIMLANSMEFTKKMKITKEKLTFPTLEQVNSGEVLSDVSCLVSKVERKLEDDKVQLVQVFSRDIFSNFKIFVFVLLCYLQHSCVLLLWQEVFKTLNLIPNH